MSDPTPIRVYPPRDDAWRDALTASTKDFAGQTFGLGSVCSPKAEGLRAVLTQALEAAGWKRTAPGGPLFTADGQASQINSVYGVMLYVAKDAPVETRAAAGDIAKALRVTGCPAELAASPMMEQAGLEKHIEIGIGNF